MKAAIDAPTGLSREEIARRVARSLPEGAYVNLGIGIPSLVARYIAPERDIILHSENGVIHFAADPSGTDVDLVDASKRPITLRDGGSYFDSTLSFALMRGGHLDVAVLGAFEVSAAGDLANWSTGADDDVPGVGGAMDLACGAKAIWVMMEHCAQSGAPKLVQHCSYPLTAERVVSRIFTDLAVLDVTPGGLLLREMAAGVTPATLQAVTGPHLTFANDVALLTA